ncbi:hypothetical protein BV378_33440 [Nostoc sp. RF31YmG]|nr:hypothetical protein BV378_33440 [Nostoc sp. RF31YmG]
MHPDNDEVCFNLAKIYQQQKNFPKAITAYTALGLKSSIPSTQYTHVCWYSPSDSRFNSEIPLQQY